MNNPNLAKQIDKQADEQAENQIVSQIDKQAESQINRQTGKHIVAEFWQCQCAPELLNRSQPLLPLLIEAVQQAGLTLVGQVIHEFAPYDEGQSTVDNGVKTAVMNNTNANINANTKQSGGVTLSLLLAESHLCLHTWGEYQTVTLDVYVCNVMNDNSDKAEALFAACLALFQPVSHHVHTLARTHAIPNAGTIL